MWTVRVFTLYPELFPGPLGVGLYKKALEKKLWSLEIVSIRDYAEDKHKTVDDTLFGGGSGMLMRADVIANSSDKNIFNKNEPINSDEDTFNGTWSLTQDTLVTVYENFGHWTWDCQLSNKMMTLTPLIVGAGNEVDWNCISNFSKM